MSTGHDVSLAMHAHLLADLNRVDAFERAIREVVRPGDVVLDVGSGTGLLALFAARAGARRVHAVESQALARFIPAVAAANGLEDRVVVHHADMTTLAPVEPVDVVIGEWLGRFVIDDEMLSAVAATEAWLRPGGRSVPSQVRVMVGLSRAEVPGVARWSRPVRGLDLSPLQAAAYGACTAAWLDPDALLGEPECAHTLVPPAVGEWPTLHPALTVDRDGTLHAVAGWFEADLSSSVTLRSGPGNTTHWGQLLWPIEPLPVRAGDRAQVDLTLTARDHWVWRVVLERGGHAVAERHGTSDLAHAVVSRARSWPTELAPTLSDRAVQAYRAGHSDRAIALAEAATRALAPGDDAAPVWENLGMYLAQQGSLHLAIDALLRALDGDLTSREQSLRFLIACGARRGWPEVARWRAAYEVAFGEYVDPSSPHRS